MQDTEPKSPPKVRASIYVLFALTCLFATCTAALSMSDGSESTSSSRVPANVPPTVVSTVNSKDLPYRLGRAMPSDAAVWRDPRVSACVRHAKARGLGGGWTHAFNGELVYLARKGTWYMCTTYSAADSKGVLVYALKKSPSQPPTIRQVRMPFRGFDTADKGEVCVPGHFCGKVTPRVEACVRHWVRTNQGRSLSVGYSEHPEPIVRGRTVKLPLMYQDYARTESQRALVQCKFARNSKTKFTTRPASL